MKVKTLFFSLLILLTFCSNGQNLIARHSGGSVIFYNTPSEAVAAAVNGDTIYVPAGSFPGFSISTSVIIYGVGYDIDSTNATGKTFISSTVSIYSSNCKVEGMYLNGGINIQAGVSNTSISRCYINGSLQLTSTNTGLVATNNVLYYINGNSSSNHFISNNIFFLYVTGIFYSTICNNIFYTESFAPIGSVFYSEINNNIFLNDNYSGGGANNCDIYNNLFCNYLGDATDICLGGVYNTTNVCDDNITNENEFSLFTEYAEGLLQVNYYQNNLHAAAGSVIISAGSDGTDLGIYGGTFPWKDGGLPQNPHIFFKSIPSVSDNDGMLDVEIKVNSQEN